MSNRLQHLLQHWQRAPELQWVLATLVSVQGSSYRKTGAMMLINSMGQHFGMLSGGCLEAEIMRQSRRTLDDGQSRVLLFDMSDEDDLAWQLGIGCGGRLEILVQAVLPENQSLALGELRSCLEARETCYYLQSMEQSASESRLLREEELHSQPEIKQKIQQLYSDPDGRKWFVQAIKPSPHIAIFGGGVDAQPLVSMAGELGWEITLCDPRSAYARSAYFPRANHIFKLPIAELSKQDWLQTIDIAIVMHHNLKLDGLALQILQQSSALYVGLLGPYHRTEKMLSDMSMSLDDLSKPLANPVGLNLGGDLPETIALSILSEAQARLAERDARSFSLLNHPSQVLTGSR